MNRRPIALGCVAAAVLAAPAAAQPPGPELLYRPAPSVPELSVAPPFRAAPLLVAGTDAYRGGEYLYQDYLFDDHGADTGSVSGDPTRPRPFVEGLVKTARGNSPAIGDAAYPEGPAYADNAADLVEFRARPTPRDVVYRVTLNTVLEPGVAAVVIGIDQDGADQQPVAWPHQAGVSSPGIDAFVTAWGTGGTLSRAGKEVPLPERSVSIDLETNQMTIRVPRTLLDPQRSTWRHVVGAGVWRDGTFESPGGGASAIFNLGFRFDEPGAPGSLRDDAQAATLAEGTTGDFFADIDFAALADRHTRWIHAPGRTQVRLLASHLAAPEGFHAGDGDLPTFGGRLQQYALHLPAGWQEPTPRPLVLALHGSGGTYNWGAGHPNYVRQLGTDRGAVVVVPQQRRFCCYQPEVYVDIFEAWADAARAVEIDPERVVVSGYSAGGYNTFRLAAEYPDLFAGAFPIVAAARNTGGGDTNWIPMLGNLRWVPWLAWNGVADTTAPYIGIELTRQRAAELGLRHEVWGFPSDHTTIGDLDEWQAAADWLGDARRADNPGRISYTITPSTWLPQHGLKADHAYWLSDMEARGQVTDASGAVRGHVEATSHAAGTAEPDLHDVREAHTGAPLPATRVGLRWGTVHQRPAANELELELRNLRRVTVDGARAGLRGDRPLLVRVTSDGNGSVNLRMAFRGLRPPPGARLTADGVLLDVERGSTEYRLIPQR